MLSAKGERARRYHEHTAESQRLEGLACGIVSVLSGTDNDARCPNFQRKFLVISHPILGQASDTLVIAECGLRGELRRSLDERSPPSALFLIPKVIFSLRGEETRGIPIGLHILIARGSSTVVFRFLRRYRDHQL